MLKYIIEIEKYRVSHVAYLRLKKKHRVLNAKVRSLKAKNEPVRAYLKYGHEFCWIIVSLISVVI